MWVMFKMGQWKWEENEKIFFSPMIFKTVGMMQFPAEHAGVVQYSNYIKGMNVFRYQGWVNVGEASILLFIINPRG